MHTSKKIILVVDSSQTIRNIMAIILHQAGYDSIQTDNVIDALCLLTRLSPDLIFIATTLPGINGRDVCKAIKGSEQTKDIPIIMLTSDDDTDGETTSYQVGIAGTLVKPFRPESVLACLATHCTRDNSTLEVI